MAKTFIDVQSRQGRRRGSCRADHIWPPVRDVGDICGPSLFDGAGRFSKRDIKVKTFGAGAPSGSAANKFHSLQ